MNNIHTINGKRKRKESNFYTIFLKFSIVNMGVFELYKYVFNPVSAVPYSNGILGTRIHNQHFRCNYDEKTTIVQVLHFTKG